MTIETAERALIRHLLEREIDALTESHTPAPYEKEFADLADLRRALRWLDALP